MTSLGANVAIAGCSRGTFTIHTAPIVESGRQRSRKFLSDWYVADPQRHMQATVAVFPVPEFTPRALPAFRLKSTAPFRMPYGSPLTVRSPRPGLAIETVCSSSFSALPPITHSGTVETALAGGRIPRRSPFSGPIFPSRTPVQPRIRVLIAGRLELTHCITIMNKTALDMSDDIAVVGWACRMPGANSIDELWSLVRDGRCSVTQVPAEPFSH